MPRTFTLEEATALLPRLREILAEMREKKAALDELRAALGEMTASASGNGHLTHREPRRKRREAEELAQRLNDLLAEVQQTGCELKGLDEGLIDFPAEREGRLVYLCWQMGEDAICFWHELETGFAGRQPL